MKPITFEGDSLKALRAFPDDARQDAGYQLDRVQHGEQPDDFKPMPTAGAGVEELRVWCEQGTFRVIYLARLPRRSTCCTPSRRRPKRHPRWRSNWWRGATAR